ncbi:hypothetical protein [Gordonia cholesterolivorans]|uniref:Uncharacterized protein n=1 Tax=Gordonia cholesterolivorans TaxID=559625 RepID=A0ABN3HSH7_9ACTN
MTDKDDFDRRDTGVIRYGWWKTNEHFSAPKSEPEAISRVSGSEPGTLRRSRDLVEDDLREHTEKYGGDFGWPVIAVDFGDGWQYVYRALKGKLVDVRNMSPDQAAKYQGVRDGKTTNRGGLREEPPRDELDILPRDLDESEAALSDHGTSEPELQTAIALGGETERRYAERVVWQRLHQPELRRLTLLHHGTACAYCGMDVPQIIEAAHLASGFHR